MLHDAMRYAQHIPSGVVVLLVVLFCLLFAYWLSGKILESSQEESEVQEDATDLTDIWQGFDRANEEFPPVFAENNWRKGLSGSAR